MSETETHIGKAFIIPIPPTETLESVMLKILKDAGKGETLKSYYDNVEEWFNDDMREEYLTYKGVIYKIEDKELDSDDDIIEAKVNDDESISYILRYYNGGTCFSECFEDALDKLNK